MAEYWDLYDFYGNLTEKKYQRDSGDPFPPDLYYIGVEICTIHHGCLLLTKRDIRKPFGGLWEYTGGAVISGEDSRTGAARELREETGISRSPNEFILLNSIFRLFKMNSRLDTYLLVIPDSEPRPNVIYQEGETVDHMWLGRGCADAFIDSPAFVGHVSKRYKQVRDIIWRISDLKREGII